MNDNKKLIIGLTGGIGSGKSQVAEYFRSLGIVVINADHIARELTETGSPYYEAIQKHFGPEILNSDQSINRKHLQTLIFENPAEKIWLENLLHPKIWQMLEIAALKATSPYVILEIPLLLEVGKPEFIDRILLVDTAEENQVQRIQMRDKLPLEKIKQIIKQQVTRKYRFDHADDIIRNDRDLNFLKEQVLHCHKQYLNDISNF